MRRASEPSGYWGYRWKVQRLQGVAMEQRTQVTEAEWTSGGGEVREALGSGGTVEGLWVLLPMEREPLSQQNILQNIYTE